ncbi:MAG: serine/threonine protein kinase [Myxococcales bacterium]|nr:serine/threonine protein kinase [Myxococcales bacterium]
MKICPTCGLRYPSDAVNCFVDRAELVTAPDPYIGQLIGGRYRIESQLGEGGMATVYAARSALDQKPVAIKIFRKELAKDEKLRERFKREATSAQRLSHPHIIEILGYGESEDKTPYLVMEYLSGESLESVLEHGPIPLARGLDLMLQTLDALARAHDFEVVHRDLKPDNLFVVRKEDGSDHVKILDFGIARSMHDQRLTKAGEVFGTPQYMAPERITSIDAGPGADLYAIGVMLYQIVANQLPFEANDISGFLLKHLREMPVPPSKHNPQIPAALDNLILKLLEKDPNKRPVDAHAVIKELSAIAAQVPRPQQARKPPPPPPRRGPPSPALEATPFDGQPKPHAPPKGTLAPATFERWERRVQLFGQMLGRAYPDGRGRPDLFQLLERIRITVGRMGECRQRSLREQMKLEAIRTQAREAQARFGRAMDTLGQDLSRVREELVRAKQVRDEYAQVLARGGAPFAHIHAKVVAAPAAPTAELAMLYRAGLEALDSLGRAMQEHQRAVAWLEAKEREAPDLQLQIDTLRGQLAKLSQASEDESAQVQNIVGQLGAEMAQTEQALMADAGRLADELRPDARMRDLFAELEAN